MKTKEKNVEDMDGIKQLMDIMGKQGMYEQGSVKSNAQICCNLIEIYYRGRLSSPLVTIQRSGRKVSRAASAACLALDAL